MRKQRAILFTRTNLPQQADNGLKLRKQEKELRSYCRTNGIAVAGVFSEFSITKKRTNNGFAYMIAALKAQPDMADTVLFTAWDRISRNGSVGVERVEQLKDCGVEYKPIHPPAVSLLTELFQS
jgi:DNA invertase Pin-like site-specific DNA recombinase